MPLTLFQALELEDVEAVEIILRDRPEEISLRDMENRVALHYAAEIPNTNLFVKLLDADSSLIDSQDDIGFTPLFVAVTSGNLEVLKLLVARNTQLDHVDLDRHTVVHWAVVCGHLEVLEELIRWEAPISIPDLHGAHPLHYAVTLDDVSPQRAEQILNVLMRSLEQNVDCRDSDGRTPLLWASSCGNTTAIQRLLESGANKYAVDRDYLNALHCAANHGYTESVQLLLKQCNRKMLEGRDKNGDTPLFYASTYGHYECVSLLLGHNADPNHVDKRLRTPQHCAAAKGQIRVLKLLRQFGASFDIQNYRGDLPFHEAVQTGNTEIVNWLLDLNPGNVNVGNFYGRTPLHLSSANGDLELVKLLCERGARPNSLMIFRNQMCTPLDLAIKRKHQPVVDYLTHQQKAKVASELSVESLLNERTNIEENVKSAKIRWNRARTIVTDDDAQTNNENTDLLMDLNGRLIMKMQRRSSSLDDDTTKYLAHGRQLLPKATSTTDLRLPLINDYSRLQVANKGAQTDEHFSQQMGRQLVEEVIRKVMGEEQWLAITNLAANTNRLPRIASNTGGKGGKLKYAAQSDRENQEDYPQFVSTDDEKAFNNYYQPVQKSKKVTLANDATSQIQSEEMDESDPRTITNLLQNGAAKSSGAQHTQFVHEKAIFQELIHLKKTQIQYGRVQERVLVRSLINNFCKMHGLNPAHFRYNTFYSWEKFLYDQLKLIYLDKRDRIQALAVRGPRSTAQFERRLRKVSPLNERLRELTRIYTSQGSSTRNLSRRRQENSGIQNWQQYKEEYISDKDREPTGH